MNQLTFAFDCEINELQDFVKEGEIVQVADTWRQHEGFTPVIITKAYTYFGTPMTIKQVGYFDNCSFKEFSH